MKLILFFIIIGAFLIATGCFTDNNNIISTSSPPTVVTNSILTDPSAPQSSAEKYCLDVTQMDVVQHRQSDAYGGVPRYSPMVTITGMIKSNCNYPVEGIVQLTAYDKNNNIIPGLFQNGIQDSQPILIKPGDTKGYTMTFDMRRVPDNPRDPDPSISANFKVNTYVTRIVSGREAANW